MLQRISALVKMELKKLIRDPAYLFLMLLFPAVLTLAFGVAFGAIGGGGTEIFDNMAPGLFAYACIFIIMTVAMSFTDYREQGLLKRINVTPTKSSEFIGSNFITNMIISIIQVGVVFVLSLLMGFRPLGGVGGVFMAFLFMALLSLCSVGLGLITASIAKSAGTAVGLSFIFILPQMFFGTFIPMTPVTQAIAQFLPSYYVTNALAMIFSGTPILSPEIFLNLLIISLMAVGIVIIGLLIYKKFGKID